MEIIQAQSQQGMLVHPTHTIIHESKGFTLIHLACLYSLTHLLEYCLGQLQQEAHPSYYLSVRDKEGNTPLHCAAMSNQMEALDIIKRLLSIESSSNGSDGSTSPPIITVQNLSGKTPYDVATVNSIRQYLLPIQLQAETQMAINNGGIGLPPGIDMGGLTIPNAARLPPPPTNIAMFSGSGGGVTSSGGSMYAPIPGLNISSNHPSAMTTPTTTPLAQASMYPPTTAGGMVPQQQQEQQRYHHNNGDGQYSSPVDHNTDSTVAPLNATTDRHDTNTIIMPPMPLRQETPQQRNLSSSSTNDLTTPNSIPRPPNSTGSLTGSSSSYALTGRSSAAIFSKSTKGGIQPDGFHSSSSDKNLQEKYGHVNVSNSALPPPPSSGNFTPDMTAISQQQPLSAPPSMSGSNNASSSSYVNPFAGGMAAAATGAFRTSARRYVTYDPIASNRPSQPLSHPQQQPASAYAPYNQFQQPQPQPQSLHQSFNPAFSGNNFQQQPASSVSFTMPPAPISGPNSSTSFSSPHSFIGKTPANTPMLSSLNTATAAVAATPSATSTFMSPPPSGIGTSTTQPVPVAPQSFASSSSPNRSGSGTYTSSTAASVFGTPMLGAPVASPAQAEITTQPARGYHRSNSTPSDAAALFAKPITTTEAPDNIQAAETGTDSTMMQHSEPHQPTAMPNTDSTSDINNATGVNNAEDYDDLDDVPLTPGQNVTANEKVNENVMHEHTQGNEQEPQPPLTNAVNSLISAIGMPPPPFSRK